MTEQENSENGTGWLVYGLEHYGKKEYEEALSCFDKEIQTNLYFGDAYYWRAKCYEALIIEELGEKWEKVGLPLEALTNPKWWEENWISPSDSMWTEARRSYEKAVELLPNDRDVLNQALDFTAKAKIFGRDVVYGLIDKWLSNNPEDASAWGKKGDFATGCDDFPVALECFKKAINLIKSLYELEEWEYDYETTIDVVKDPEGMLEGHRSDLENALLGNFTTYRYGIINYSEMLKCFWELYYLTGNEFEIINSLTSIILGVEDKHRRERRLEELQQKTGLTPEESERKTFQNQLIDTCTYTLKRFLITRLKQKYRGSWWEKGVPQYVISAAEHRKISHEENHPDQERQHPIKYLNVREYHKIICEEYNWNEIFRVNFSTKGFIIKLINELADYRNTIKHNGRLLTDDEIKELEVILHKIEKCIQ
jgi:tetratricopeptide (TPR) repeat protein